MTFLSVFIAIRCGKVKEKGNWTLRDVTVISGFDIQTRLMAHFPYRHQKFQFSLLDAAHCGTVSEHQVSNGILIGLFALFILSPFTQILNLSI